MLKLWHHFPKHITLLVKQKVEVVAFSQRLKHTLHWVWRRISLWVI